MGRSESLTIRNEVTKNETAGQYKVFIPAIYAESIL